MKLYQKFIKRALDIVLSGIALIILAPVFLLVYLLVKIKLGSPALFIQERPGKNQEIFKMYKFRTMTDERGEHGELLPDEIRLTKFGKLLRSTSLDELPELWNIFTGDMSFVGPRPLLVKYLPFYTDVERLRHTVRPGLTGLSQVNGRNNLDWDTRLKLDIEYVRKSSLIVDISIIFKTIYKVLKKSDIVSGDGMKMKDLDDERRKNFD